MTLNLRAFDGNGGEIQQGGGCVSNSVNFTFRNEGFGGSFEPESRHWECALQLTGGNGSSFENCGSPGDEGFKTYANLSSGTRDFLLRIVCNNATDPGCGFDGNPYFQESFQWTIFTNSDPPAAPVITFPDQNSFISSLTSSGDEVVGTSEPATLVEVYTTESVGQEDGAIGSAITDSNSNWAADITLAEGMYDLVTIAYKSPGIGSSQSNIVENVTIDNTAPTVIFTDPADGQGNVPLDQILNATVSEQVSLCCDESLGNVFKLNGPFGPDQPVAGTVIHYCNSPCTVFTFEPSSPLEPETTYTATLTGGVEDNAGNRLVEHTWSFTTGLNSSAGNATIAITSVNNTNPLWGIDVVGIDGNTNGSASGDAVNVTWGDSSPDDTIAIAIGNASITSLWSANHTYGPAATGPRNIVATLVGNGGSGSVKATSDPEPVTVQKHPTSLGVSVPGVAVIGSTFTASGTLNDTAYTPAAQVSNESITFTGTTRPLDPALTQGVTFTQPGSTPFEVFSCSGCTSEAADGNFGNKLLKLNVGGQILMPDNSFEISINFDDSNPSAAFEVDVALANGTTVHYTDPRNIRDAFSVAITSLSIVSVGGSSSTGFVGVANLKTAGNGHPEEQHHIDFENLAVGATHPNPLIFNEGSYFAVGSAPTTGTGSRTVQAHFAGSTPYIGADTGSVSYELHDQTGDQGASGSETPQAYVGQTYNAPTQFGSGGSSNSALCTYADPDGTGALTIVPDPDGTGGLASAGDVDADGICDIWESATTPGNDATHRYITCPKLSTGVLRDDAGQVLDCDKDAVGTDTVRYDLCFTDPLSNVWGGAINQRVCPKVGHKDIYVEIDYMAGHSPNVGAVKDVIMAFGNAPITLQYAGGPAQVADHFGRATGVTLHVVIDEQIPEVPTIEVWADGDSTIGDDFATIKEGTAASKTDGHFGTVSERTDPEGPGSPPLPADAAKVLNMKHYVYRYGLFAHQWGACPGGSSGIGEILGNDFVVTLGCGFGVVNGHSVGTRSEQAGTFMHELGHTLNLRHGGPVTILPITAVSATDYDMNCKPNYLSVMNYQRQFPGLLPTGAPGSYNVASGTPNTATVTKWEGVRVNTAGATQGNPVPATGAQTWPGSALDYSRTALPNLDENALVEANGIPKQASSPPQNFVFGTLPATSGTTGTSTNWNKLSTATETVSRDITDIGFTGCMTTAGKVEKSFDDWRNLKYYMLHDSDSRDGSVSSISLPSNNAEQSALGQQQAEENAPPLFEGVLQPINKEGNSVFKLGKNIPVKLQLKDTENQFIVGAQLTFTVQRLSSTPSGTAQETEVSSTFTAGHLFTYDSAAKQYKYNWKTTGLQQGTWAVRVYENYGTADQRLLQGPQPPTATGATVRLSLETLTR